MGFKIRDKSLFWTRSGWKNNWEPKILNMPRPVNSSNTMYVLNRNDHHSFLRSICISKCSGAILSQLFAHPKAVSLWKQGR